MELWITGGRSLFRIMAPAAACLASAAAATSIATRPPHDPAQAPAAIAEFFARVDAQDVDALEEDLIYPMIYSDSLGLVSGEDELRAFLMESNAAEGHPDRGPKRILRIRRIIEDRNEPVYVVVVERTRWVGESVDELTGEMEAAGYMAIPGTWLVQFDSNQVASVREADELYPLASDPAELAGDDR